MNRQSAEESTGAERVCPYGGESAKGEQVEQMFDSIAPAYDFMNTAMTFGLHRRWRDKAIGMALATDAMRRCVADGAPFDILDVATGTGDVAFTLARRLPQARVTGIDLSTGMLDIARDKRAAMQADLASRLAFEAGDCLDLKFADNSFQMVTVAYGVRNFEHLAVGLKEMCRVLRPGGVICIIELSRPTALLPRLGYDIYSRAIIPAVGRLVSGDRSAYTYLPRSIAAAPQRADLTAMMTQAGFSDCSFKSLTLGAVTIYLGFK